MSSYRFRTVDVFTDQRFGGNPLAVFPDADGLSSSEMQAIANEFNLSETVFVLAPDDAGNDIRLRIFTPQSEMPFAGHPTVGGAVVAAWEGLIDGSTGRLEEPVGVVAVELHRRGADVGGATLTAAQRPEPGARTDAAAMARVLGLDASAVSAGEVWSCGLPFVVVEVDGIEQLGAISVDPQAMAAELAHCEAQDVYAVARTDGGVRARMFAPFDGIPEDPATGSAACAFAGWWAAHTQPADGRHQVLIRQGVEMGRTSELRLGLEIDGQAVSTVTVGGDVVAVSSGELTI
ncbi:MAG: PhzF family phenazine biosynthesis protein [Acidimicrobiales bacterium]